MPADFEKQAYWHERFASETAFEWLLTSAQFMSLVRPHLAAAPPSSRVLNLGSGTSDLQNHLRAAGFEDVVNIDFEPLAADRGRDLEKRAFGDVRMRYAVADATQMEPRRDGVYDLVVDKSTVDAVSCGGEGNFMRMARSVRRCLSEGACWISLSFSAHRFDVEGLPFDVEVIGKVPAPKLKQNDPDIYHWCYLMRPT